MKLTAGAAPLTAGKTAEPAPSAGKTEPAPSAGKTEPAPSAGKTGPAPSDAKTGTKAAPGDAKEVRLAAVPPPSPKPFIEAAALLLEKHPAEADLLRSFKPDLAEEATQIRAALADLRARRPPETDASAEGAAAARTAGGGAAAGSSLGTEDLEPDAPASGDTGASAAEGGKKGAGEQRRIDIKGEARAILRQRGPPRSILLRDDGTFVLRYDGPLRCASPPCPPTADFNFSADGERLREAPAKAKAPAPAKPSKPAQPSTPAEPPAAPAQPPG